MIDFKVLISSAKARCKRPLIVDPHIFSSFSNTNFIAWLNVYFFTEIYKYYHCFKILLSDYDVIIWKYCKLL